MLKDIEYIYYSHIIVLRLTKILLMYKFRQIYISTCYSYDMTKYSSRATFLSIHVRFSSHDARALSWAGKFIHGCMIKRIALYEIWYNVIFFRLYVKCIMLLRLLQKVFVFQAGKIGAKFAWNNIEMGRGRQRIENKVRWSSWC